MQESLQETVSPPDEQDALVLEHLGFAQNLARQFYRERSMIGVDYEDFEGAAMLGLCDAAQRYSIDRGSNFRTFAYFRIRGAMYDLLRRHGSLPRQVYRQAQGGGAGDLRSPVTHAEHSEPMRLVEILERLGIQLHPGSSGEAVDWSYLDGWDPERAAVFASSARYVARFVGELPEPERTVIRLRYYEGISFEEIRRNFPGASKSWISRLHLRAVGRLRALVNGTGEAECAAGGG